MSKLTHVNGSGHDDVERERIIENERLFRDAMNEFIRDERPKTWGRIIVYMVTLATHLQRTKRLELEQRIEALEARAANFKFVGAWREGRYARGNFASLGGALFYCDVDSTEARPGTDNTSWSLVCPRPRDGRDGAPGRDGRDAPAPPEPPIQRTVKSHR